MKKIILTIITFFVVHTAFAAAAEDMQWLSVITPTKIERSKLVNLGMSIENVVNDTSYGYAPPHIIDKIKAAGFHIQAQMPAQAMMKALDFPPGDAAYHNYQKLTDELDKIAAAYPNLVKKFSIGKSLNNRDIWALQFNTDNTDQGKISGKPGFVVMGGHHAREHLSVEMPLKFAQYLVAQYGKDATITNLLNTRELFIIPNVNPDGSEYDIQDGTYKMWRKNRRDNQSSCAGVDLNRNYGFDWGTGGSSTDPCSDIYMGPKAFSEPETQAIKSFVEAHINLKVLLTFHSYSELILYPWGHTYDAIANEKDHSTYNTMAKTMAGWNGYTPEQSSELYIASGDTTDWSYGQLGIFSFTFELSPTMWGGGGGFYPGPDAIEAAFNANLRPLLYLFDLADDPYRAVKAPQTTLFY